jgi:hypothetical protein
MPTHSLIHLAIFIAKAMAGEVAGECCHINGEYRLFRLEFVDICDMAHHFIQSDNFQK